jgi:hypothetical protein
MVEKDFNISRLTLDEKEAVVRVLFNRINGKKDSDAVATGTPSITSSFGAMQAMAPLPGQIGAPPRTANPTQQAPFVVHPKIMNNKVQQRFKHMISGSLRVVPPSSPSSSYRPSRLRRLNTTDGSRSRSSTSTSFGLDLDGVISSVSSSRISSRVTSAKPGNNRVPKYIPNTVWNGQVVNPNINMHAFE